MVALVLIDLFRVLCPANDSGAIKRMIKQSQTFLFILKTIFIKSNQNVHSNTDSLIQSLKRRGMVKTTEKTTYALKFPTSRIPNLNFIHYL